MKRTDCHKITPFFSFCSEYQFQEPSTAVWLSNQTTTATTTTTKATTTTLETTHLFYQKNPLRINRTKEEEEEYQRNFLILKAFSKRLIYRVFQKKPEKEMSEFLSLKMSPLTVVIQFSYIGANSHVCIICGF